MGYLDYSILLDENISHIEKKLIISEILLENLPI